MNLISLFQKITKFVLSFFSLTNIIIIFFIILCFHIIAYFFRDKKYINDYKQWDDSEIVSIDDLKSLPLVNFIIPAWKDGELFENCLISVKNLSYPNLKVIINAGGSKETIKIAKSFEKYPNFIVIEQKKGGGKIKAINEGINYVSEGLVYIIDADSFISSNIFFKMIYQVINNNQDVVVSRTRPLKSQVNKDLVKYVYINRNSRFKQKFKRYLNRITPHTCLKYEILKSTGKFQEKRVIGDGLIGTLLFEKGYKIYQLKNYSWCIPTYNPDSIKVYFNQNIRWIENRLLNKESENIYLKFIKFLLLNILSLYLIIFPIFIFFHIGLFLLGNLILFGIYLKKIRKIILYKKTIDKNFQFKLKLGFFIKLLFYIYIEAIMNLYTLIEVILFGNKKLKKRKNIE